jgi:hydroxyacylglutathione hydrolase
MIKFYTFNPFAENTYIVADETTREAIIFDPGCYSTNDRQKLKKYIDDNNLTVKRLINTHCHLDHVFGNTWVTETYGVAVECHRNEVPVMARAHVAGAMYGTPMPPQPEPTLFIEDGDVITLGNLTLEVILAPGHSPGSLCFYNATDNYLIGGDVLFFRSIGRTDLPLGNYEQLIHSIQTRIMTLPDEVTVYSGHGQPTTIGYERYNNPFLQES